MRDLSTRTTRRLSKTIDSVQSAIVTHMSAVCKTFSLCGSCKFRSRPMNVAQYGELARSLQTKLHLARLKLERRTDQQPRMQY
jgi:hypothetical protein